MADIVGRNGQREEFRVVGKPNKPGILSYALASGVAKFGADYTAPYISHIDNIGADGVRIPFAPLTEVTEADWLKVIATNLTGMFHCLKYELVEMQKRGGAIVNTASIGGLKMAPGFGAYGPSKAGVIAITQTAAVENAKAGIRVNVICPGPTDGTNLMADSKASGAQDTEFLVNNVIPMGKLGTTDDIADSVVFLCSSMAGHITGCALPVCGGMQM